MTTMRLTVSALLLAFTLPALSGEAATTDADVEAAHQRLLAAKDWRAADTASERLGSMGRRALPAILKGTRHEDYQVREYCYTLLQEKFPTDPAAVEAIVRGLNDESTIGLACIAHLGEHGISRAAPELRKMYEKTEEPWRRHVTAMSLAQLGDARVIRTLYVGLGSDHYMLRHISNIGIKALSGRDLNDFDYDYGEGAFVSGTQEYKGLFEPIREAELKAARFQAIASFCKWLKRERPKLYELLK